MENDRDAENPRNSISETQGASLASNGMTSFIGIVPRNGHRSNAGRSSRPVNSHRAEHHGNSRREIGARRSDTSLPQIPNIRFRSFQSNHSSPTSSTNDCNSSSNNTAATSTGAGGASAINGDLRTRSRHQPGGRNSNRNQSTTGGSPKGRSGTSPRRNTGRSSNNPSLSNRSRGHFRSDVDQDDDVDLTFGQTRRSQLLNDGTFTNASITRGLGTEDQPFELLNDSDVVDTEDSVSRDEEIARQLQREEWERASTPAPSRLQFLQAVHGAMGSNLADSPPRRRGRAIRLPGMRAPRGGLVPPAFQLPDLFDILPVDLVEMILGNGQMLAEDNGYEALLDLGDQIGAVSRGLNQGDIDRIPVQKHKESALAEASSSQNGPPQCSICLAEFEPGDVKRILPCEHQLHKNCIDQWLKTNATCPVCRKDVRDEKN